MEGGEHIMSDESGKGSSIGYLLAGAALIVGIVMTTSGSSSKADSSSPGPGPKPEPKKPLPPPVELPTDLYWTQNQNLSGLANTPVFRHQGVRVQRFEDKDGILWFNNDYQRIYWTRDMNIASTKCEVDGVCYEMTGNLTLGNVFVDGNGATWWDASKFPPYGEATP